ncbi:MAG: flagellar biosynthetic protein FliR [Parvularculaceae bacterium]|nr:flagellar biosynthetic protein FliR [Parvularculaceae bacterium]
MSELLDILLSLADGASGHIPVFVGVFCRISAAAFLMPGFGEPFTPIRVRLAAVFAFTIIVAPTLSGDAAPFAKSPVGFFTLVGAEILTGLVIGFALRLAIIALQTAGVIAAQHLQMSQLFGPGVGHDQETPLSGILLMAALALATANDLHIDLAAALVASYSAIPIGAAPASGEIAEFTAQGGGEALRTAFALATPFVLLGFAYSIALGAMNRAMPSLMASFVGAPAILIAGLTLFAGTASVMLDRWNDAYAALITDPFAGLR